VSPYDHSTFLKNKKISSIFFVSIDYLKNEIILQIIFFLCINNKSNKKKTATEKEKHPYSLTNTGPFEI
jgi:hypothetical protein